MLQQNIINHSYMNFTPFLFTPYDKELSMLV